MMTRVWRCLIVLVGVLVTADGAMGYLVGPAVKLEKMVEQADVIFKGVAVADEVVKDEWFKPCEGFRPHETRFKVVSVIKGRNPGDTIVFHHYDADSKASGWSYAPQYYHVAVGETYLVFAVAGERPGVFRQMWVNHTVKRDQGVVRCRDDKAVEGKTAREVIWSELGKMLGSSSPRDVIYAIGQLDEMSNDGEWLRGVGDFERKDVLALMRELMASPDAGIAQAAIAVVGADSPYLRDSSAIYWLATVGAEEIPGIGKMDAKRENRGGKLYWKELAGVANGRAAAETRALAIRALGRVGEPALGQSMEGWLKDSAAGVRGSAVLLLVDLAGPGMCKRLTEMAGDGDAGVRVCVAHAAGFGQDPQMAKVLAGLLGDKEDQVRDAAAESLLAFSPRHEAIAQVFRANLKNADYGPFFLNALARQEPAAYLDALAQAVEAKGPPRLGGRNPAFTSWEMLFRYLQGRPIEEVRSGKLDRYLDAMEKVGQYSSSEPRDIYAFYLQRGMTLRAARFRERAKAAASYDLDYYFKMVDENPAAYKRE